MARKISSRIRVAGTLKAITPLHIGGYGVNPDTDMPLAQNGAGQFYIPGTSLAGVIRAWCEETLGDDLTHYLFGPPMKRGEEDVGHASFILVEDAVVTLPAGLSFEVRDGIGIDRVRGVAADKAKFDRAVLPRNSTLRIEMTVEAKKDQEAKTKAMVGHLLNALDHQHLFLGAARTRGLGRVSFKLNSLRFEDVSTRAGILELLSRAADAPKVIEPLEGAAQDFIPTPHERLRIEIKWRAVGPLMVKASYDGISVDVLPLVSGTDEGLALVIPGSSIKGALRSHAERIIRTLRGQLAKDKAFHEQICRLELIDELFGSRGLSLEEKQASQNHMKPGRGALSVADCYATESLSAEAWRNVESAIAKDDITYEKQELWEKLNEATQKRSLKFHPSHHVAIDRWTGGASDGALFSVLAPTKVDWERIALTLDFNRLSDNPLPALMLLLLTLRDMAKGRVPIGFGANRGMGAIEVESFSLTGVSPAALKVKQPWSGTHFMDWLGDSLNTLQTSWATWLDGATSQKGQPS